MKQIKQNFAGRKKKKEKNEGPQVFYNQGSKMAIATFGLFGLLWPDDPYIVW